MARNLTVSGEPAPRPRARHPLANRADLEGDEDEDDEDVQGDDDEDDDDDDYYGGTCGPKCCLGMRLLANPNPADGRLDPNRRQQMRRSYRVHALHPMPVQLYICKVTASQRFPVQAGVLTTSVTFSSQRAWPTSGPAGAWPVRRGPQRPVAVASPVPIVPTRRLGTTAPGWRTAAASPGRPPAARRADAGLRRQARPCAPSPGPAAARAWP